MAVESDGSVLVRMWQSYLPASVSFAAAQMTPQQYHKDKGPSACPGDKAKDGSVCGKRSAFCKSGGVEVKCFIAGDVGEAKKGSLRLRPQLPRAGRIARPRDGSHNQAVNG